MVKNRNITQALGNIFNGIANNDSQREIYIFVSYVTCKIYLKRLRFVCENSFTYTYYR